MADIVTVADLVEEIREQSDEMNVAAKSDDAIVRVINRGQRWIAAQLARGYRKPLVARTTLVTTNYDSSNGIEMPRDAFEDRIVQVYANTPVTPTKIEERDETQVSAFEYKQSVPIPQFWYIRGRNIITVPPMQSTYNLLVDYVRQPDPCVLPLGRVSEWDATSGAWLSVADLDTTQLSTTTDSLASFINIVDGLTGRIKCTLQVSSISSTKLNLRAVPTYTEVYGRTVSTSFAALLNTAQTITADDYACLAKGTCVPQFGLGLLTYLVEYSVAAIGRSLGDAMTQISDAIKKDAKEQAEQQGAGRPNTLRVKNRSRVWGHLPYTRPPYSGGTK